MRREQRHWKERARRWEERERSRAEWQQRRWEDHAQRWEKQTQRWEAQGRRWEARWESRQSPAGAAVGGVGILTIGGTLLAEQIFEGFHPLDSRGWALLVLAPLLLGARRKAPIPVALLVTAVLSAYYLLGYPPGPGFVALLVALHALQTRSRRWMAWTIAVAGFVAFITAELTVVTGPTVPVGGLIAVALWTALVMMGTEAGRAGRERAQEYRARRAEAERSRLEGERRRVSDERLRIAREVHDLLGHHLSLINVQSGVALHLMDTEVASEAELRTSLVAIKQSSKDALVELRATVNALRGVDEDAPRQPTPTLDRLDDLLAGATATGLAVTLERVGEPREPLPARVDLAAFRIVQEALTNVRRHAGPVSAVVTLEYGNDLLVVRIDDPGPDGALPDVHLDRIDEPPPGGGNGIPGMRERAQSVGGTLQAGPKPDGGFRVRAELPL
ncbi:sensor histidine kinase [Cryptosporangium sp. NPDC048952]|uniref:sensor histidine kinase n=1 Tax=Cryptosporangium sp. NPDC048952 TaxID=3363961 RepID=UPI0037121FE0